MNDGSGRDAWPFDAAFYPILNLAWGGNMGGTGKEDFGGDDPLAGVAFQRRWERAAFEAGGGDWRAPAQKVGDFLRRYDLWHGCSAGKTEKSRI